MKEEQEDISLIHVAKALKEISKHEDMKMSNENKLIENLMLLQATIVGFSAAFLSISTLPAESLQLSRLGISIMLFNIFLGVLSIRGRYDQKSHENFSYQIFNANQKAIDEMVSQNVLEAKSEEYKGLIVANLVEYESQSLSMTPDRIFSDYAKKIATQWKNNLPQTVLLKEKKGKNSNDLQHPAYIWLMKNTDGFVAWFFLLVPVSFSVLVISLFI